ncbi:Nicotinate-nucleotide diphosphorylase [Fusarium heterosporum]|uniref:Nicotinate-nucleotide diphosphorylase n=1 Tax=Fusarium heterosporum TaxID=42747 RepID=A0A8H5TGB2_FUSHE|nr:Nicotinate-nucleotide diphosphorylase [Fusarium heterosporum]
MVNPEWNPGEDAVGAPTTQSPPHHSQQNSQPILSKSPDDLDSSVSSPRPQSDGDSSATETYIEERKRQIVDSIVFNVTKRLLRMFDSYRERARGDSSGPSGTPDESLRSSSKATSSGGIGLGGQKRNLTETEDDGADDDDDDRYREGRQSGKKPIQNRDSRKYACPYFKYNPTKYKDWRICPGPGWADIPRLKRHRQPKYRCGRCWQPFRDEQCYMDHLRTEEACPLAEMAHVEGFDSAQEQSLRSRKRSGQELSENDKWRRIFKILFPHVLHDDIPSPFYEYDQVCHKENNHQPADSEYLAQCEHYMVREVPQRLRQALGRELDRDLTIVEESLRRKAGDWAKTLIEEAFREIRQSRRPAEPAVENEKPGLVIGGPNLQSGSSESNNLRESEPWPNLDLESFDSFLLLGETEFAFDNGGLLEDLLRPEESDHGKTGKPSDSGYSSHNPAEYTR